MLQKEDCDELVKMFELVHDKSFKQRKFETGDKSDESDEDELKEEKPSRNPYQRDYARILYSSSFRRLQGKMQILGIDNTSFFRNRLTHSLEVGQIAIGILDNLHSKLGNNISFDDYFVLEAAALAHDIGHPAFGHSGERVLDKLGKPYGIRFEGNAQNFRVLRKIEKKFPTQTGLHLTYRTLLAINKYIKSEDDKDSAGKPVKKFMFKDDYKFLYEFRDGKKLLKRRTIDVQIIELADDIAYAVHDLEDGLSTRNFNIDELLYKLELKVKKESEKEVKEEDKEKHEKKIKRLREGIEDFKGIVSKAKEKAMKSKSYGTNQEYSQVFRNALSSSLVKLLLSDLSLENPDKEICEIRGTDTKYKELTLGKYSDICGLISKEVFKCISREPHIAIYEARGEKLVTDLFNLYSNPDLNKKGLLLPPDFRKELMGEKDGNEEPKEKAFAQASIDYIAGMMDDYAKAKYKEFFNKNFEEIDFSTPSSLSGVHINIQVNPNKDS